MALWNRSQQQLYERIRTIDKGRVLVEWKDGKGSEGRRARVEGMLRSTSVMYHCCCFFEQLTYIFDLATYLAIYLHKETA